MKLLTVDGITYSHSTSVNVKNPSMQSIPEGALPRVLNGGPIRQLHKARTGFSIRPTRYARSSRGIVDALSDLLYLVYVQVSSANARFWLNGRALAVDAVYIGSTPSSTSVFATPTLPSVHHISLRLR